MMTSVLGPMDGLWDLFWTATYETVYIVAITLVLGGILGLVLGLGLYVTRSGGLYAQPVVYTVLNLLVNFFRPIPFVIFVAAVQPAARVVVGIGIGNKAIIFGLTLALMFGVSRLVERDLLTVEPGVIEAARSMGASRARIIRTVVLPESLGPLILGYTFAFVALVDMSAVAGIIGGGGLGNFAQQYGFRQFEPVVTWTAVVVIVIFVQIAQFTGNTLARKVLRR